MVGKDMERPSDRASILIVHQDKWMRAWLSEVLTQEGYHVLDVPNADVGRALYGTAPIDLVITDILMPVRTRIKPPLLLIRDLLKAHRLFRTKVIAITANFAFPPRFKVWKLFGIRNTLMCPFTREQLFCAVRLELESGVAMDGLAPQINSSTHRPDKRASSTVN